MDSDTYSDVIALADLGYLRPKFFDPDHWAAVIQEGSFAAIVDGDKHCLLLGYRNRWRYPTLSAASVALHEWVSGDLQPRDWISAQHSQGDEFTVWP